jgi:4-amino-4-deoxy-L-arabinose transferase-like glycosyltransferase
LLLGAILALVGTAFYFFGRWHIEDASFPAVLIGVIGTVLGFFQLKFKSFIRLILNMCFAFGAFLILVGIDAIIESLFVDFFVAALIVFWILTRIQLSQWDHWRICSNCKSPCEVQEAKKK